MMDEKFETLSSEELQIPDLTNIREEDAAQFPQELIVETGEEYTLEKRQNLYQKILKMSVPEKIRLAVLGNREARKLLIHDRTRIIPMVVLRSPKLSEGDVLNFAQQKNISDEVIVAIARSKAWLKYYPIKLALASNPKTPLSIALRFLDHLHDKDLQALSRSKEISPVVAQTAGQILFKRKKIQK